MDILDAANQIGSLSDEEAHDLVESGVIEAAVIDRLMRWYGRGTSADPRGILDALAVFRWCAVEVDAILFWPRDVREEAVAAVGQRYGIDRDKVYELINTKNELMRPQPSLVRIAIEGIDGAGKSLIAESLRRTISERGEQAAVIEFPAYDSFFGNGIGRYLSGDLDQPDARSMALWYALDRWHAMTQSTIAEGFVILNRYTLSNVVFQSLRSPGCEAEVAEWVEILEHEVLMLPRPDLYVVLDVPVEIAVRNIAAKTGRDYTTRTHDVYESATDLQEGAAALYRKLASERSDAVLVPCTTERGELKDVDAISFRILQEIERRYTPLRTRA
jgi:dTMP kinase